MAYTPANLANFFLHYSDTESYEKSLGDKVERYMDDLDHIINDIIESWALKEVADITALRALYEYTLWDSSATQHITRDNQIRKVISASDGTNTYMALYWFDDAATDTDADGATGNVDTDGIVAPLVASGSGRWKRIAGVQTDGTAMYVYRDGLEALRTMLKYLYINLTAGSSDVAVKVNKRTAGSQIKITVDEEIAIRNIADNAYEDIAAGLLTLSGNLSGAGTANVLSGAPVASATSALLRLGAANTGGSASGGFLSINSAAGYAGDFIRILLDAAVRLTLSNTGALTCANTLTVSAGGASIAGAALNMNTQLINNVVDPSAAQDAATKNYVDTTLATGVVSVFGDGSDGALTSSSGTTTLTRDMFYSSITLTGTAILVTAGYRVFCNGTCSIASGTFIRTNGVNGTVGGNGAIGDGTVTSGTGAGGAGGAGGTAIAAGYFPASLAGVTGGAGASGTSLDEVGAAGSAGTAGNAASNALGNNGAAGSAGGGGGATGGAARAGGAGGAGGAAGAATALAAGAGGFRTYTNTSIWRVFNSTTVIVPSGAAGAGAGGGGGAGGNQVQSGGGGGGGGGGSGSNGGFLLLAARSLANSGTIQANGGNGAAGGNGNSNGTENGATNRGGAGGGGGGGSGGSGGVVVTISAARTGAGTITATGGTAGGGGTGGTAIDDGVPAGTIGVNGTAGTAGAAGTAGVTIAL